jgi:hypothetical protein
VAADGEEILMDSHKKLKDLRGPQARISRLASFHMEAYIHMLFYRILVPLSIIYGISVLARFFVPGLGPVVKVLTLMTWILWTPQVFEVAKGLALAWSRGMAFGHLNEEFAHLYKKRYSKKPGGYIAFPYVVLVLWAVGFIVLLIRGGP